MAFKWVQGGWYSEGWIDNGEVVEFTPPASGTGKGRAYNPAKSRETLRLKKLQREDNEVIEILTLIMREIGDA